MDSTTAWMTYFVSTIVPSTSVFGSFVYTAEETKFLVLARSNAVEIHRISSSSSTCEALFTVYCGIIDVKLVSTKIVVFTRDLELLALGYSPETTTLELVDKCSISSSLPSVRSPLISAIDAVIVVHAHVSSLWSTTVSGNSKSVFSKPTTVSLDLLDNMIYLQIGIVRERIAKHNSQYFVYLLGHSNLSDVICVYEYTQPRWSFSKLFTGFSSKPHHFIPLQGNKPTSLSSGTLVCCDKQHFYLPPVLYNATPIDGPIELPEAPVLFQSEHLDGVKIYSKIQESTPIKSHCVCSSLENEYSIITVDLAGQVCNTTFSIILPLADLITLKPRQKRDRIGRYFARPTGDQLDNVVIAIENWHTTHLKSESLDVISHLDNIHQLSENVFVSTSRIADSVVLQVNGNSVQQLYSLNSSSNGPILDLQQVDKFSVEFTSPDFQLLVPTSTNPAIYATSGNYIKGEFTTILRGLSTTYLGELCADGELDASTSLKLFLIDEDTCALVTLSPNESPKLSLLKSVLQLTKELDIALPKRPLDLYYLESLFVLYPRVLWCVDLYGLSTSKLILPQFHSHNFSKSGFLWLYDQNESKMYCVDLVTRAVNTLTLSESSIEVLGMASTNLVNQTLYLVISDCESEGHILKIKFDDRTPTLDSSLTFSFPENEVLESIHITSSPKSICLLGSTLTGCVKILRLEDYIQGKSVSNTKYLSLKISNTKVEIFPSSSQEHLFYLKSNDSESQEISILCLHHQGNSILYDIGVLDLKNYQGKGAFSECLYDKTPTVFAIKETGIYGYKLNLLERSEPESTMNLEVPESLQPYANDCRSYFSTVSRSLSLRGVPRKFAVLPHKNVAVVVSNYFPSVHNMSSKVYVISLEHPSRIICELDLPETETIDVCHTSYKFLDPKGSVFQDRTSVGLQNMMQDTFIVLCGTSNGISFRLFSFKNDELTLECCFDNTKKSDFFSVSNFGYRIFVATGNKTGFFRIGFKPSSSRFFIERAFEKKICRGYTDFVKCVRNTVFLNDMYNGVHSFNVKQITYLDTNIVERNKGVFTVKDYAVANGYEDYEMPVRVSIEGLRVLSNESFTFDAVEPTKITFLDLENALSTPGNPDFIVIGENINVIACPDTYRKASRMKSSEASITTVCVVGTASGGIHIVNSIKNESISKFLYKCGVNLLKSRLLPSEIQNLSSFDMARYVHLRFSKELLEDGSFDFAEGHLVQKVIGKENDIFSQLEKRVLKGIMKSSSLGYL